MDDKDELERDQEEAPDETEEAAREPYVPSSFEKRTAAWMGLGYVVILLFIITFSIYTGGKGLPGTFPLLLVPVAVAAAVIALHRAKAGVGRGGWPAAIVIVVICAAAAVFAIIAGGPALVQALRTAHQ